ncbi:MAG: nuclear transport factor 2 family protein [Clostridia bacterium]|nr:nuclear transport factor 2 family protein [Clostridia bacterium]
MEARVRGYFQAWLEQDLEAVKEIFAENVVYSECYGPEYRGLSQIIRWFTAWNERGRVLEWRIKRVLQENKTLVAEWYFQCQYEGVIDGFDGVSIVDFDDEMKIVKLREFQSKAEHYFPYGEA